MIQAHWPQILHIIPDNRIDDLVPKYYLPVERTFTLTDNDYTVEYQLVGQIYFDETQQHWKSNTIIGSRMFAYDDMLHQGSLVEVGPDGLMNKPNYQTALLVYNRTSSCNTVS